MWKYYPESTYLPMNSHQQLSRPFDSVPVSRQTLLSCLTNETPRNNPPAEIVEVHQQVETKSSLIPDPAAIDVTTSNSVTAIHDLPFYVLVLNPCFRWRNKDGETFAQSISVCYKETMLWRQNLLSYLQAKQGIL